MANRKGPEGAALEDEARGLGRVLPRREKFVPVDNIIRCLIDIFTFTPRMATVYNIIR